MKTSLIVFVSLLVGGCRLTVVKESDIFWLKRDVAELQREVARLQKETHDLSQGYCVVPVTVTFTNMTATAILEGE